VGLRSAIVSRKIHFHVIAPSLQQFGLCQIENIFGAGRLKEAALAQWGKTSQVVVTRSV
jgi:hypothetical protein